MTKTKHTTLIKPLIYAALAALFVSQTANIPTAMSGSHTPLAAQHTSVR